MQAWVPHLARSGGGGAIQRGQRGPLGAVQSGEGDVIRREQPDLSGASQFYRRWRGLSGAARPERWKGTSGFIFFNRNSMFV